MKKTFNWLVAMFAIVAVCTACSKGDDGPNNPADAIIGKWECVHSEGWYKVDGVINDEWSNPNTGWGWVFNKDGTGYNYEEGYDDLEINWTLNQNKITIDWADEDYDGETYTIESASENELVLSFTWEWSKASSESISTPRPSSTTRMREPENTEYYEKLTFTRRN